jgi:hypothetical protein
MATAPADPIRFQPRTSSRRFVLTFNASAIAAAPESSILPPTRLSRRRVELSCNPAATKTAPWELTVWQEYVTTALLCMASDGASSEGSMIVMVTARDTRKSKKAFAAVLWSNSVPESCVEPTSGTFSTTDYESHAFAVFLMIPFLVLREHSMQLMLLHRIYHYFSR